MGRTSISPWSNGLQCNSVNLQERRTCPTINISADYTEKLYVYLSAVLTAQALVSLALSDHSDAHTPTPVASI